MLRNIPQIADDLDRAAAGLGPGGQPFRNLAEALRLRSPSLAGTDLASAFSPEQLLPDRDGGWLRALDVVRTAAVLAPLAIAGWQLREALGAHAGAPAGSSFLAGWREGFGHTIATLGDTAQLVALGVTGAITFVAAARVARDVIEARALDRRVALSRLISEATLALAVPAGLLGPAGARLARAAAAVHAATSQLVGTAAGGSHGPGIGFHHPVSRVKRKIKRLADAVIDTVAAGDDPADLLAELHDAAEELTELLAESDPPSAAAARDAVAAFTGAAQQIVEDDELDDGPVPPPRVSSDLVRRGDPRMDERRRQELLDERRRQDRR